MPSVQYTIVDCTLRKAAHTALPTDGQVQAFFSFVGGAQKATPVAHALEGIAIWKCSLTFIVNATEDASIPLSISLADSQGNISHVFSVDINRLLQSSPKYDTVQDVHVILTEELQATGEVSIVKAGSELPLLTSFCFGIKANNFKDARPVAIGTKMRIELSVLSVDNIMTKSTSTVHSQIAFGLESEASSVSVVSKGLVRTKVREGVHPKWMEAFVFGVASETEQVLRLTLESDLGATGQIKPVASIKLALTNLFVNVHQHIDVPLTLLGGDKCTLSIIVTPRGFGSERIVRAPPLMREDINPLLLPCLKVAIIDAENIDAACGGASHGRAIEWKCVIQIDNKPPKATHGQVLQAQEKVHWNEEFILDTIHPNSMLSLFVSGSLLSSEYAFALRMGNSILLSQYWNEIFLSESNGRAFDIWVPLLSNILEPGGECDTWTPGYGSIPFHTVPLVHLVLCVEHPVRPSPLPIVKLPRLLLVALDKALLGNREMAGMSSICRLTLGNTSYQSCTKQGVMPSWNYESFTFMVADSVNTISVMITSEDVNDGSFTRFSGEASIASLQHALTAEIHIPLVSHTNKDWHAFCALEMNILVTLLNHDFNEQQRNLIASPPRGPAERPTPRKSNLVTSRTVSEPVPFMQNSTEYNLQRSVATDAQPTYLPKGKSPYPPISPPHRLRISSRGGRTEALRAETELLATMLADVRNREEKAAEIEKDLKRQMELHQKKAYLSNSKKSDASQRAIEQHIHDAHSSVILMQQELTRLKIKEELREEMNEKRVLDTKTSLLETIQSERKVHDDHQRQLHKLQKKVDDLQNKLEKQRGEYEILVAKHSEDHRALRLEEDRRLSTDQRTMGLMKTLLRQAQQRNDEHLKYTQELAEMRSRLQRQEEEIAEAKHNSSLLELHTASVEEQLTRNALLGEIQEASDRQRREQEQGSRVSDMQNFRSLSEQLAALQRQLAEATQQPAPYTEDIAAAGGYYYVAPPVMAGYYPPVQQQYYIVDDPEPQFVLPPIYVR